VNHCGAALSAVPEATIVVMPLVSTNHSLTEVQEGAGLCGRRQVVLKDFYSCLLKAFAI